MTDKDPIVPLAEDNEISLKSVILSLKRWWNYLFSKWYIFLICGFLGGTLGVLYAHFQKPIYTAETTFVLEEDNGGGMLGSLGGLAGLAGIDVGGGGLFQGDNILQLYKSRTMIAKSLLTPAKSTKDNVLLIDYYIKINNLREKWADKPHLKNIDFAKDTLLRSRDSLLLKIVSEIAMNHLSVEKLDKKLSIISVRVTSGDEIFSKDFADNIVENVNSFYVNTKTKKSLQNVQILQHKADSVKSVLNGTIYASASLMDATPNLNPTRQVLRAPMQRSQFNAEMNKEILIEIVKNLEMSKLALRKETPLIQVVDSPIFPLPTEKLGRLKGLIIGSLLAAFLAMTILILNRIFKDIMN